MKSYSISLKESKKSKDEQSRTGFENSSRSKEMSTLPGEISRLVKPLFTPPVTSSNHKHFEGTKNISSLLMNVFSILVRSTRIWY